MGTQPTQHRQRNIKRTNAPATNHTYKTVARVWFPLLYHFYVAFFVLISLRPRPDIFANKVSVALNKTSSFQITIIACFVVLNKIMDMDCARMIG
jgi:hypothetical protein